ncbi:hypothetical protein KIPB_001511 [Kipferlia bialata]|uniref:Uncharacterized protein n=2 Tax=Kipferlia bialata TaxID=797122 RepID=A0A9K3CQQ9_9EUKA|nr:hypothetical protein KIPB_001511 [Kipferlia bialata]|eukprot:g1511.t1
MVVTHSNVTSVLHPRSGSSSGYCVVTVVQREEAVERDGEGERAVNSKDLTGRDYYLMPDVRGHSSNLEEALLFCSKYEVGDPATLRVFDHSLCDGERDASSMTPCAFTEEQIAGVHTHRVLYLAVGCSLYILWPLVLGILLFCRLGCKRKSLSMETSPGEPSERAPEGRREAGEESQDDDVSVVVGGSRERRDPSEPIRESQAQDTIPCHQERTMASPLPNATAPSTSSSESDDSAMARR